MADQIPTRSSISPENQNQNKSLLSHITMGRPQLGTETMSCYPSQRKSQLQICGSGELNRSHLEHESEMLTDSALRVSEPRSAETDPRVKKRRTNAVSHSKSRDSGYDEASLSLSLAIETTKKGRDNKQSNEIFTCKKSEQISMGGHQLDAIIPSESGGLEVPKSVASDQKLTGKGESSKRPESFSDRSATPDAAYQNLSDKSLDEFLSTEEQRTEATEKNNLDSSINVKPKTKTGNDIESNERELVTENICDGLLGKRGNSQNKPPITPRKSIQKKSTKKSSSNFSRLESESHASKPASDECATDCALQAILSSNVEVNSCQVRDHVEIKSLRDDPDQKFREHSNQINDNYEISAARRGTEIQTDPSLSHSYNGNVKSEQRVLSQIISRLEDEKKGFEIEIKKFQQSQEKMSRRIRELEEANREWASYDAQREKYVQDLIRRKAGLEEKCSKDSTENQQLRDEISRLVADNKKLAQTISELKDSDSSSKLRECEDQLELLREQVRQCTKDFQAERGDRERAESKVATLEDEVRALRGMNQQSRLTGRGRPSVEVPTFEAQQRTAATDFRREQLSQLVADCQPHGEAKTPQTLRSRGCAEEARFFPHFGLPHQQLEVDCHSNDQFGLSSEPRDQEVWDRGFNGGMDCADGAAGLNDAKLRCPKCWREYPPHRHLELLEHIDICCD